MRHTLLLTKSMVDIKMMEIDVKYQNRCSLGISLKFESVLRKIQSHIYIDSLILEIIHKSCKEPMCKRSCLEINFSLPSLSAHQDRLYHSLLTSKCSNNRTTC